MPIEDDRQLGPNRFSDLEALYDVVTGEREIGTQDSFLYPLSGTSGNVASISHKFGVDPNFLEALADIEENDFRIVGLQHRTPGQSQALRKKKKGALVLLMREPGNRHDSNAVVCLVAASDPRGGFLWRPVGYLSRKNAARLAPHWLTIRGIPVILQATLVSQSDYHAQLSWFSEYTSEVKFRDIDYLFSDFLAGDSYA